MNSFKEILLTLRRCYNVTADIIRKQQCFVLSENLDNSQCTRIKSEVVRPSVYYCIHPISVGWKTIYINWCELISFSCTRVVQNLQAGMKRFALFFVPGNIITNGKQAMKEKLPIDYQLDYMERLFYKLKFKKTESYVIHRIWDKLDDCRIQFVTQQLVKLPDGKRALADLYLPQLDLFVEVNEPYHEWQKEEDEKRNGSIVEVTKGNLLVVQCGNPDKPGEWLSLEEIHKQIDNVVDTIKAKISCTPDLKPWNTNESLTVEYHKKKGVLHLYDGLRTIDDVCAVFGTQPKHRGFLRMGATPVPNHDGLDIWYPIKDNNKGWKNEREDNDDTIIEYHEDLAKRAKHVAAIIKDNRRRITFFRSEDALGIVLYRFLGVYQLDIPESEKSGKCVWRRISKEYKI